jgi:hypothetical protein
MLETAAHVSRCPCSSQRYPYGDTKRSELEAWGRVGQRASPHDNLVHERITHNIPVSEEDALRHANRM